MGGDYFEHLLNEENPRAVYGDGEPNENLTPAISREEVVKALRKREKQQDQITPRLRSGRVLERKEFICCGI